MVTMFQVQQLSRLAFTTAEVKQVSKLPVKLSSILAMSVRDYVQMGMKSAEFGIDGYFLPKTANTAYEKPLLAKILPGKKRTFIDEEIAKKKFVPPAIYEVAKSLIISGHKSNLDKGARKTLADDIAAYNKKNAFPAPNTHKPSHSLVHTRLSACLDFKGERVSQLDEAMFKGK